MYISYSFQETFSKTSYWFSETKSKIWGFGLFCEPNVSMNCFCIWNCVVRRVISFIVLQFIFRFSKTKICKILIFLTVKMFKKITWNSKSWTRIAFNFAKQLRTFQLMIAYVCILLLLTLILLMFTYIFNCTVSYSKMILKPVFAVFTFMQKHIIYAKQSTGSF